MPKYGMVVDYEFCVGCQACEIACKQENNRPDTEWGVHVTSVEPEISGGGLYYIPFFTDNCNLCGKRIARGLQPACVKHCWAGVIKFGTIAELARYMESKPRTVLWVAH